MQLYAAATRGGAIYALRISWVLATLAPRVRLKVHRLAPELMVIYKGFVWEALRGSGQILYV